MMRFFLILLAGLLAVAARADDGVTTSKNQLERQIALIDQVKGDVETEDLPRLLVLQSTSRETLAALLDPARGPLHSDTHREFQNLVITYNFSKSFLDQIETDATAAPLSELWDIAQAIAKAQGLDHSPEAMVTLSVFDHMHQLFLQLLQLDLEPGLQSSLRSLEPSVGEVAAIAEQGDHYKTYQAAIPVCRDLRGLYPDLVKVPSGNAAFELVLELQGLNEFYIEYSQIDEAVAQKS